MSQSLLDLIRSQPDPLLRADGKRAIALWRCGECYETHDDEQDALDCCQPDVYAIYECPECALQYDERSAAVACCPPEGTEHGLTRPTPKQLESAGQQRIF